MAFVFYPYYLNGLLDLSVWDRKVFFVSEIVFVANLHDVSEHGSLYAKWWQHNRVEQSTLYIFNVLVFQFIGLMYT